MNFFKNIFSSAYEELWKAVIRPNRDKYSDRDLGPEKFCLRDKWYKRTDFTITNKSNHKLMCSFWEPFDEEREFPRLPCVIYLHGNSSSRCEVIPEIKFLLTKNITVFAFDFSGCGRSEGDYISLGWHEQDDVECVVNFLRKSNKVSTIGIWGRSMGAVTALMYGSKDYSIAGLVLDSPFSSLRLLIDELAKSRVALPEFVVKQAIKWVKEIIKDKANFNLDDIEPREYAGKCFIPAFFCHSKGDTFVNIHHCKDLYNLYAGDKNIVYVRGNHNTERPIHFKDSVAVFFYKALRCKTLKESYEKEGLFDLKFNIENNTLFNDCTNLKCINNKLKKKTNSVSEIKICLRGRYDKNIFNIENNKKEKENNKIEDDKKVKNKLRKSENDIIMNLDDNISIKKIVECPKMKINSNYIKYIYCANNTCNNKENNIKLIGPTFNSSFLNKTPIKRVIDDDTIIKSDIQNKTDNNKDEENIQKILQLSKKEFEEISTNTPNFMNNNAIHTKLKNKSTLSLKKVGNKNLFNNIAIKNSMSIDNYNKTTNNLPNGINKTIQMKSKPSILSAESIYFNNKLINKSELTNLTKKIFNVKSINRSRINKINKHKKKNYSNNNIIINNINKLKNKNNKIPFISSYLKTCSKPSPTKINFPELFLQLNKNNTICSIKENKSIKKNNNTNTNKIYNNISFHNIYNFKNQKEEHKNIINNNKSDLLENVIASPLNNHLKENNNKIKKLNYINTTNNTSSNNNIINNLRRSESSLENESETIINSKIDNKINDLFIYLEDDDNFFLEEDNIGINIPHS